MEGMIHQIHDTDKSFTIDPITRAIKNDTLKKLSLVIDDHNSEIFTFELPRTIEGHDMAGCNKVEVHYVNTHSTTKEKSADVYKVKDYRVSEEDPEKVIFSWTISKKATKFPGSLAFAIHFACIDETSGEILYWWSTSTNTTITVLDSINLTEETAEENKDLQEKTATPTKDIQVVRPDDEFRGLSRVVIDPIPDEYIIPTGTLFVNANGDYEVREFDKIIVNVEGEDNSPLPTGIIGITENGTHDVTNYANANVNVEGVPYKLQGENFERYLEEGLLQTDDIVLNLDNNKYYIVADNGEGTDQYYQKISGGDESTKLNIHYGTTEPTDTSKLWVKSDITPNKVEIKSIFNGAIDGQSIEKMSTVLPRILEYPSCGVVGNKCYVFGGGGSGYTADTIYCYDTETNIVETMSTTLSKDLQYSSCGVVGTKCYLFGGYSSGSGAINTIYCYNTETNIVETMSTTLPKRLWRLSCGVVGTKCYIFGGYDSNSNKVNTIYCYDTETNTIKTMSTTLPKALHTTSCGVVGTKCYIFGGYDNNSDTVNTIYCYDTETNTIKTMSTTLPKPLFETSCGVVGTKCYVFGGKSGGDALNTIYCYDTETNTIKTMSTNLPEYLQATSCGVVGTKCYIFGGHVNGINADSIANTIYKFIATLALTQNNLLLINGYNKMPFELIEGVEMSVEQAFIGNSNNEAEVVKAAVYKDSAWVDIN